MKFLIDAQLLRRMAAWLVSAGRDSIRTLDLPGGNRTSDEQAIDCAEQDHRTGVSRYVDFAIRSGIKNGAWRKTFLTPAALAMMHGRRTGHEYH
jgi:predicted nuclease of predicted toxin-antitoxin system